MRATAEIAGAQRLRKNCHEHSDFERHPSFVLQGRKTLRPHDCTELTKDTMSGQMSKKRRRARMLYGTEEQSIWPEFSIKSYSKKYFPYAIASACFLGSVLIFLIAQHHLCSRWLICCRARAQYI